MRRVMVLTWGKSEEDGGAGVGCDRMDFGGQPTSGASDGLGAAFGEGACSVGMDLDRRGVQPDYFEIYGLFGLETFEHFGEYSAVGPAAESHVDGVPGPEPGG